MGILDVGGGNEPLDGDCGGIDGCEQEQVAYSGEKVSPNLHIIENGAYR